MNKITPFVSIFIIALFFIAPVSAGYITPTKENVTEVMSGYDLKGENNSLQLACEIGEYVSEEYNWNCDIRELIFSKHAPVYINVFYPSANTARGHDGYYAWFGPQKKEVAGFWTKDKVMNYRDWGSEDSWCGLQGVCSYGIVKSYFGDDTEEEVITDPVILPENETPVNESYCTVESNNNSIESPNIVENSTVVEASGNNSGSMNSVENSSGVINNQGNGNWFQQLKFELSNISNSTINFFVGH